MGLHQRSDLLIHVSQILGERRAWIVATVAMVTAVILTFFCKKLFYRWGISSITPHETIVKLYNALDNNA
jgi:hypothetical protein